MAKSKTASFILTSLIVLRPPENLLVSEWAEKERVLDAASSAIPGKWSNSVTPYLVDIMNEFNNPETEEIIFVKPSQVGGTEVLLNVLGYTVGQDPYPAMLVYPTDRLGEVISDTRIKLMLRNSPSLRRKFHSMSSTKLDLKCDGMYISIVGANSPSGLASRPIGRLFLDEVDKFPSSTKKEANPIKLARERTKTFANRKIFITSTPTIRQGHIWQAMEGADIVKKYFVPCPHCGEYIELLFKQVRWPNSKDMSIADRAECANYICQNCGCIITDAHKGQMLNAGKWKTTRGNGERVSIVAYWINTLYSPFVKWAQIAKEWMLCKESPETMQNFINSWLAEPWEDVIHKTDSELVMSKRTEVPEMIVPEWAKLLTAGVDIQQNSLYFTIRAWGNYLTSQKIYSGEVQTLDDISDVMNCEYFNAKGESFIVALACIDSGHQTDEIYDFCFENSEWAIPIKGSSHPMVSRFKISTINKTSSKANGTRLITVDGNSYKDIIAARLNKEKGRGGWMVDADTTQEYAQQVTAEQKVNEKRAGRTFAIWKPRTSHADNHYLDCEVYAFCAADLMDVRGLHLEDEQKEPQKTETEQAKQNTWLNTGGGWLK